MSKQLERALDGYLTAAAQAGDRKAWRVLAARWSPRLSAFAWRLLGDREGVEDVVQDAWLEIVKDLSRLRAPEAFPAFAFRIVQRRCAKEIGRRQRGRRLSDAVSQQPPSAAADPDQALDADRVLQVMRTLPAHQHAALWLFHIQGLSVAEIAAVLDVPTGTVKTRLMHARRKIAAHLQGGSNE